MKAIMTAILMIGFVTAANASTKRVSATGEPTKIALSAQKDCPYRNHAKLDKPGTKMNYDMALAEAPTRSTPALRSAPRKGTDSVNKNRG